MTVSSEDDALLDALRDYAREEANVEDAPLGALESSQLFEEVLKRVGPIGATGTAAAFRAVAANDVAALPAPVRRQRTRRTASWLLAALVPCAAAALLLTRSPRSSPLPSYALRVESRESAERSQPPASSGLPLPAGRARLELSVGSELRVVLVPARAVDGDVEVEVEARGAHGQRLTLRPPVERAASGALRVRAIVGSEWPLAPGHWETHWRVRSRASGMRTPATVLTLLIRR
jgi:hypothetical protein